MRIQSRYTKQEARLTTVKPKYVALIDGVEGAGNDRKQ
jgi:hypothetical protein